MSVIAGILIGAAMVVVIVAVLVIRFIRGMG